MLHRFAGGSDGISPEYGDLTFDSAGNVYGATSSGGGGCSNYGGCGVAYKISRSDQGWTESVLYAFAQGTGQTPYSGVTFDSVGNLYGTLLYGGSYNRGTVYELTQSGSVWTEKTLHNVGQGEDGAHPFGGLIFDQHGNLNGTTFDGGTENGGTIYELQPSDGSWSYNTLYNLAAT